MNQLKRTTLRLTIMYSVVFFVFIWSFSAGIYVWTDSALGKGYIGRINELVEGSAHNGAKVELSDNTATIAADVAMDRMRNIIIVVNVVGIFLIPTIAYQLSKRSLRPLVKSQEEQRAFIASASHELRTPLAVISGELELGGKSGHTAKQYRQTIIDTSHEVDRMTNLVHQLLLLSRISSESELTHMKNVDVSALAKDAASLYEARATAKHVSIQLANKSRQPLVRGQHELLLVAVSNLIDNAVKFSDDSSSVLVKTEDTGSGIRLSIQNKGPEIAEDKRDNLFDHFYQAESSHSSEGYGLGLAITKQIVQLHRGRIDVASDQHHTTFMITLPQANR